MGLNMTERGNNRQRTSRRAALTGTALALGAATAATVVRQAEAQQKLSQAVAKYQGTPDGNDHCEVCSNFQLPNTANSSKARSARKVGANYFPHNTLIGGASDSAVIGEAGDVVYGFLNGHAGGQQEIYGFNANDQLAFGAMRAMRSRRKGWLDRRHHPAHGRPIINLVSVNHTVST
jgi:hypothetical protein